MAANKGFTVFEELKEVKNTDKLITHISALDQ
jgi:hypothetical protein